MYWPGMSRSLVDDLVARIRDEAGEPSSGVRYVGCHVAPHDEVCYVRVDAVSQRAVDALTGRLELRGTRVSETIEIRGTR